MEIQLLLLGEGPAHGETGARPPSKSGWGKEAPGVHAFCQSLFRSDGCSRSLPGSGLAVMRNGPYAVQLADHGGARLE